MNGAFMKTKKKGPRPEPDGYSFKNKMAELSELPKDVALGMPVLTVLGQMELSLENYRGIIEYTDTLVRIPVSYTHLFRDFTGPLGRPSEFVDEDIEDLKKKKILFVAGGVGAAPVYPQVKWMKEHGIDVDVIVGSKTKDMLILEDEMKAVAGNYYPCTDDGTSVSYTHLRGSCQRRADR